MANMKNEHISEATSTSVDNAREFILSTLESMEKAAKVQLDSSKKMLNETSKAIKQISSVDNPKDAFSHLSQLANTFVESNISSCRDSYEIMSEVQSNVGKLIESSFQHTQQNIANTIEGMAKYNTTNGANSESIQNWMNSTNQAINTMQKMASQIADFTNQSFKKAAATQMDAAKKATAKK